jgi:hypothetical protein
MHIAPPLPAAWLLRVATGSIRSRRRFHRESGLANRSINLSSGQEGVNDLDQLLGGPGTRSIACGLVLVRIGALATRAG